MSLVEQVASGIPRMRDEMKEAGLPEPIFTADGGFFTVAFKRPIISFGGKPITFDGSSASFIDTVNDTVNAASVEDTVLAVIKKQQGLSSPSIAKAIGKSIPTTKRYLGALVKAGKIEFVGAPKTGGYYLKK